LKHLLIASVFGLVAASPPPAAASWQSVPQVVVYNQSCDIAIENGVPFTDWIGVRSCSAAKLGKPAINACHSTAGVDDGCSDLISDPLTGYLIAAVVDGTHTCPGAGCNVKIAYNQGSRSGSNWTQATVANRPLLITNCINTSFPCMQGPTGQTTSVLVGASFTSSVATTIMQVFQRPTCGATGAWFSMVESGNGAGSGNRMTVQTSGGATGCGYQLAGASGVITVSGSTVWHSMIGVVNGASSVLSIDGADTTGTVTGVSQAFTSRAFSPSASASDPINAVEMGFIDNVAVTAGVRTALCTNQRTAWGLSSAGC
jgi:hypothetical protein